MKTYIHILAAAAITVFSGCANDFTPEAMTVSNRNLVFTATMENGAGKSRATIDNTLNCASWEEEDLISINGVNYSAQSAGTQTTFKAANEGEEAEGDVFKAYFPAGLYNNGTLTLPGVISETWKDGAFNMPMYASSTTTDLAFKNLCGVLKVIVKSTQIASVKSIKVSSLNHATSGVFTVNGSNAAILSNKDASENNITVTYTESVTTSAEGTAFYIAIPPQVYNELMVVVSDGTNSKVMTTAKGVYVGIERNKIYPLVFEDNTTGEVNGIGWVQLWAHGPKFADRNARGNSCTDAGIYCNGRTGSTYGTRQIEDLLTAWHVPSAAEIDTLIKYTDQIWCSNYNESDKAGFLLTGKDDFANNSIFLPAAGYGSYSGSREYDDGQYNLINVGVGYYLTSTRSTNENWAVKYLHLNYNQSEQSYNIRINTLDYANFFSVRLILNENEKPTKGTLPAAGVDNAINWVQLWENGPKFATVNVGVTDGSETKSGNRYSWINDGSFEWGSNWRMPTEEEMDSLISSNKCETSWTTKNEVNGWLFTGKGKFSDNSIFIPAFSAGQQAKGSYWTATSVADNQEKAYMFMFSDIGLWTTTTASITNSFYIRAVVNE